MPANAEVDFQKIKMKDKHRELRAAIAAIRRNNRALLAVLPQWRCESGDETAKDNVTAFFRERGEVGLIRMTRACTGG